ncbi:hypothetical protein [Nostoc sp. 'Peltigera membranacea cyanobiont' 213]|nr:hypothetical protein [Nostoc sp. 'Peltigera membranacea cyanobiont' 213]
MVSCKFDYHLEVELIEISTRLLRRGLRRTDRSKSELVQTL